eukprot:9355166-Pyramimonas_sp.AAC.1
MVAPVSPDLVDSISLPPAGSRPTALGGVDEAAGLSIARQLEELLLPRQLGLERIEEAGPKRRRPRLPQTAPLRDGCLRVDGSRA